jgi:hypothetical protein
VTPARRISKLIEENAKHKDFETERLRWFEFYNDLPDEVVKEEALKAFQNEIV